MVSFHGDCISWTVQMSNRISLLFVHDSFDPMNFSGCPYCGNGSLPC